jgi:hypothetical protein
MGKGSLEDPVFGSFLVDPTWEDDDLEEEGDDN